MHKANWKTLLAIVSLLPMVSVADEQQDTTANDASYPGTLPRIASLDGDLLAASSWPLSYADAQTNYSDDWRQPMADFEFREGSALMRLTKLRSLSLLTLAKVGKSRLFFGVNDDGFVGLHFSALSSASDERYLEVVRMPYLSGEPTQND